MASIIYQTVQLYRLSRDPGEIFACRQRFRLKKHPRDILRNENHLYGIVLVHIMHTTKYLQMAGYRIFKLPKLEF